MAVPEPPHGRQNFLGGFKLTLEQLGRPPVTRQYPEEKRPKQPRQHGRHVLNRYEDGMEKCIGCELCAGVCPADCIYVRGVDNPPDHPVSPGERYGFVYEINFLRCIHCDMCVEACPTEAITESKLLEFSFTNRSDAIYTKDELLVDDDGRPEAPAVGGLARGRRPAHVGLDAGHVAGRATPPSRDRSSGRASSASACGPPRAARAGAATTPPPGSCPLRETLERHLRPADMPAAKRGPRGAIGRALEKAERFRPGLRQEAQGPGRRRLRRRRCGPATPSAPRSPPGAPGRRPADEARAGT